MCYLAQLVKHLLLYMIDVNYDLQYFYNNEKITNNK